MPLAEATVTVPPSGRARRSVRNATLSTLKCKEISGRTDASNKSPSTIVRGNRSLDAEGTNRQLTVPAMFGIAPCAQVYYHGRRTRQSSWPESLCVPFEPRCLSVGPRTDEISERSRSSLGSEVIRRCSGHERECATQEDIICPEASWDGNNTGDPR